MSHLFAVVYDDPDAARRAADGIRSLAGGRLPSLRDMVVVSRDAEGAPSLDPSVDLVAGGALGSAFWNGLVDLVFAAPLPGAAGAAVAPFAWLADYGIDDDFVRAVAARTQPGRAVLFILADEMVVDRLAAALGAVHGELLSSSLTANVDAVISAALAGALQDAREGDIRP